MTLHTAPALHRGLTVLEMLSQTDSAVGFNQITESLSISKSSVARILSVLRERGYASREPQTGRYIPGPRMASLGQRTPLVDRMRDLGTPLLETLTEQTSNTSMLFYWNGEQIQALAKKTHPISIAMQLVGSLTEYLLSTPWGWIFYGSLSKENQSQIKKHSKSSSLGPVASAYLKAHIQQFPETGYMLDNQQLYTWVRRFAAPVYDHQQQLVGAIALGGNTLTIPDTQLHTIGQQVKNHALQLSHQLGYVAS